MIIEIQLGEFDRQIFNLDRQAVVAVGRSSNCDVVVPPQFVQFAQREFVLEKIEGKLVFKGLHAMHVYKVNGNLTNTTNLEAGQHTIEYGSQVFKIKIRLAESR